MLHPFPNAKSRVRLMILQTEMVRNGGHPVMLDSIDSPLYQKSSAVQVRQHVMEGWCAWEFAMKSGKSPIQAKFTHGRQFADKNDHCHTPDTVLQQMPAGAELTGRGLALEDKEPADTIGAEELDKLRAEYGETISKEKLDELRAKYLSSKEPE